MEQLSRRQFVLDAVAAVAVATSLVPRMHAASFQSPFRVAVINDEISPDFDHACSIVSREFGLSWIELRSMWGKNVMDLDDSQIAEAKKILAKYNLQVTDIASPLFKTDWPGAPRSPYGSKGDMHGAEDVAFKRQDEVLEKSVALARQFNTGKVRCFDFWRLDDVAPFQAAIHEKLRSAAELAGKEGILLVLENEFECNTATGREAARTLQSVQTPHLALNWDPGNAVMRGELDAFPGGWEALPKNRIHHCHVKSAASAPGGKMDWAPVGTGYVDWAAQFRALRQAGYHDAVSLETHWHGAATPEQSTRVSWAGMKKALQESGSS